MNTQPIAAGERDGWEAEEKLRLMFKGKDSYGIQSIRHPACIFLLLPAREAGIPETHSFNKYLLRDFFVLVSMPGALITQFQPVAIRVLAANRILIRWFK